MPEKPRFALLDAIEDGQPVRLCFLTEEDARRFKKFTNIYMSESGAGNGYGAYWVWADAEIGLYRRVPSGAKTELNLNLVLSMMDSILTARTATDPPTVEVTLTVATTDGAIAFSNGELPPRQRPAVGDMYRCIKGSLGDYREGRVIAIEGGNATVRDSWDEEPNGSPKPGAQTAILPLNRLMKINDWLAKLHGR